MFSLALLTWGKQTEVVTLSAGGNRRALGQVLCAAGREQLTTKARLRIDSASASDGEAARRSFETVSRTLLA